MAAAYQYDSGRFLARKVRLPGVPQRGSKGRCQMTRVQSWILALGALALFFTGAGAQEPRVRASLTSEGEIWVGQRANFVIELLAPGYLSGVPAFDLPSVPGMQLVPPNGSPVVTSEEISGTS